ncbi:MAG TPA: tetratricopeptide repeat protein, partial [Saprospiraceae bacterium]|nr:tetratricopeptide repeat protein [Saprospiraceae bacterium]
RDKISKALTYTAPLLGAVLPFLVIRSRIIGGGATGKVLELMNNPFLKVVNNKYVDFSFGEKFSTIFYTLGEYVRLLIFPQPLTSDYYPHHVSLMHFGDWQVILSMILYLGLFYLAIKSLRQKPLISFGIFIYFASLSIVSNFLFPVGTFMAERFLFMPSVGFSMVIGVLLVGLIKKDNFSASVGLLAVILLLFSIKTITRNPAWKNDETLFLTDVKISKKSAKIQNAAGGTLLAQAGKAKDKSTQQAKAKEAIKHLNIAVKEHPNYKNAWLLLGNAYNYLEQYDQSINAYQNALRIAPGYKDALKNLAVTYRQAGQYFGEKKGNPQKAITYLKEAEKLSPNDPEVIRLIGIAYAVSGQINQALPYLEKAFAATPNNANLALDLSMAYGQAGNIEKATYYQKKALDIDPDIIKKRQGGQ